MASPNSFINDRWHLQRVILQSVAAAGLLAVGLVAPNTLGAMYKLGLFPGKRSKVSINASRDRLLRKGWLVKEGGKLRVTSAGEKELKRLEFLDSALAKPKRWDKKWRLLIFDIPEKRRGTRAKVRRTLLRLGFSRLQDSVWVYPYDCEDVITLLKADFRIGKDILYVVADSIEGDGSIRRHFDLL